MSAGSVRSSRPPLGDLLFLAVVAVSTVSLTFLRLRSIESVVRWWVPAFELVVIARALLPPSPWSRARTHLVIALAACLAGDLLINWTPWGRGCVALFAVTHLNLLWIFVHLRPPRLADLPSLLPWCAASAAVFAATRSGLPAAWMVPAMVAYLLLLDLSAWRAVALLRSDRGGAAAFLAAGEALFFATDHFVILQMLRANDAWVVATWICYPPALALLALSSRRL